MNDEELTALAEQLYASGLDDDAVDMHLQRALMGQQPEQENHPFAAALQGVSNTMLGRPSGQIDPDNKAIGNPKLLGGAQEAARDQFHAANALGESNPWSTFAGEIFPLLIGIAQQANRIPQVARATSAAKGAVKGGAQSIVRGAGKLADHAPFIKGPSEVAKIRADRIVSEEAAKRAPMYTERAALDLQMKRAKAAGSSAPAPAPVAPQITDDPIAKQIAGTRTAPTPGSTSQQVKPPVAGQGKTLPYYPRGGTQPPDIVQTTAEAISRNIENTSIEALQTQIQLGELSGADPKLIAAYKTELARRMGGP
jgi:hypothetical protein